MGPLLGKGQPIQTLSLSKTRAAPRSAQTRSHAFTAAASSPKPTLPPRTRSRARWHHPENPANARAPENTAISSNADGSGSVCRTRHHLGMTELMPGISREDLEPAKDPSEGVRVAREAARRLKQAYGERLVDVVLFGSWVRGQAHEESDVDLLVLLDDVVDRPREKTRIVDALFDLEADSRRAIQAFPIAQRNARAGGGPFVASALEEGVTVFGVGAESSRGQPRGTRCASRAREERVRATGDSRAYYAAFYAARAALQAAGEQAPKTHSGLRSRSADFARTSPRMRAELGRALSQLETSRTEADAKRRRLRSRRPRKRSPRPSASSTPSNGRYSPEPMKSRSVSLPRRPQRSPMEALWKPQPSPTVDWASGPPTREPHFSFLGTYRDLTNA